MRRSLWLVGVLACLVGTAHAAPIPDYPFVFVTGHADAKVPPDIATCSLTVRAFDADPARALAVVAGRSKAILHLLSERGVAPQDVQAYDVTKEAVTSAGPPPQPPAIRGYRVSRRISFVLRRLGDWPPIAETLLGAENVDDLGIAFDRSDRRALAAELLRKAAADATAKAGALAQSFGRRLGAAVAISQAPFDSIGAAFGFGGGIGPRYQASVAYQRLERESQGAVPATIEISADVNAVFKVE